MMMTIIITVKNFDDDRNQCSIQTLDEEKGVLA